MGLHEVRKELKLATLGVDSGMEQSLFIHHYLLILASLCHAIRANTGFQLHFRFSGGFLSLIFAYGHCNLTPGMDLLDLVPHSLVDQLVAFERREAKEHVTDYLYREGLAAA
jgi:hypothetical protein